MTAGDFLRGTRADCREQDAMIIRPEKPADIAAIDEVVAAAFGRQIGSRPRASGCATTAIWCCRWSRRTTARSSAMSPSRVCGSRATERARPRIGLAPVSVLPERQRKGIGARADRRGAFAAEDAGRKDRLRGRRSGLLQALRLFARARARPFGCVYQGDDLQALRLSGDAPAPARSSIRRRSPAWNNPCRATSSPSSMTARRSAAGRCRRAT